jgi:hypothetical protein
VKERDAAQDELEDARRAGGNETAHDNGDTDAVYLTAASGSGQGFKAGKLHNARRRAAHSRRFDAGCAVIDLAVSTVVALQSLE